MFTTIQNTTPNQVDPKDIEKFLDFTQINQTEETKDKHGLRIASDLAVKMGGAVVVQESQTE